jgi:16S rRNA processing protein RimM
VASEPVVLGRIVGVFGVRGWVKVFSYTKPREAVLKYEGLLLAQDGKWQPAKVAEGQRHGKSVIARLQGVNDRDQAAALVGGELVIDRAQLPEPEDGHYYWSDLIGLKVVRQDGTALGIIDAMLETGTHDVMQLKGEQERLIPFVKDEIVLNVDFGAQLVTVDWEWD